MHQQPILKSIQHHNSSKMLTVVNAFFLFSHSVNIRISGRLIVPFESGDMKVEQFCAFLQY
jgi:hypothetical protein